MLNEAFRAVMNGGAAAVSVYGPSGIGKSALVRRFLSQIGARDDVVVLSGRCYENESVPYKALDGVIDDLSRYLGSIPRQHVENLMPHDRAGGDASVPRVVAGGRHRATCAGIRNSRVPILWFSGGEHSRRCASCSADSRIASRW